MNNCESLIELYENGNLKNNPEFALRLASEMNNYYIGDNVSIPENNIVKIIGKSKLDSNIVLMPYQLMALKQVEEYPKVVLSAPTSFGKSFLILEFIKRNIQEYSRIAYVVHTKSLKEEVFGNIKKYFADYYKIVDDIDDVGNYDRYVLVIVSDGQNTNEYDIEVDLLIVDEAYNLSKQQTKERHYAIMRTYHKLLEKATKVILLGPFINKVMGENSDSFYLIQTDYSPVVQQIKEGIEVQNSNPNDKFIDEVKNENKTIGYFGSKNKIYNYIDYVIKNYQPSEYSDSFISWMESYFPDFWLLPKLMKRRIGLYHSAFPKYINLYNMDKFNNGNFNGLITTSAILEGVNTSSKSMVIFDSTAGGGRGEQNKLTSFQFFNLCGRTGRLGKEIVGFVYNYGDSYKDRYKDRQMPLYIGNDDLEDPYGKFDDDYKSDIDLYNNLKNKLADIGINIDEWYDENSYYSMGVENMFKILDTYDYYKHILKSALVTGILNKKDSNEVNKNELIKHFYINFVKYNSRFKYKNQSRFSVVDVLPVMLRSTYNGIDFSMRDLCQNTEIASMLRGRNPFSKNTFVLELMNLGYNYLPHAFFNISYLFNEFLLSDSFWNDDERIILSNGIYERVLLYVNGSNKKNAKIKKILSNMGVLPPTIDKILKYIDKNAVVFDEETRFSVVRFIMNNCSEIKLDEYEVINMRNIGISI